MTLTCSVLAAGQALTGSAGATSAPISSPAFDAKLALRTSQAAVGMTIADHQLTDGRGRQVSIGGYRGKPLVVSLVYTSCYHSCSVITRNLKQTVEIARDALGDDSFEIITVGFDAPTDNPARMASYARRQGVRELRWAFLSASPATVRSLTAELGFTYVASPRGFDHLAQTTILDAEGVVYRQVYGDAFAPPSLVEPLKELVFGSSSPATISSPTTILDGWIDNLKLVCTVYDPASGRYRFDYSIFVAAAVGSLCLSGIAWFLFRAWRETRGA